MAWLCLDERARWEGLGNCSRKLRFRIVSASSVGGAVRPSDLHPRRGKAGASPDILKADMVRRVHRGRAGDSVGGGTGIQSPIPIAHPRSDDERSILGLHRIFQYRTGFWICFMSSFVMRFPALPT